MECNEVNDMDLYAADNENMHLIARVHLEERESGICKRDPFQRDRDRIMHSRAFRRMMHKTQVVNANMGDHYRNRLTHTLEVSQIARSIGKALHLNDELIEAIALGHDLGHTPFGHVGERTLDDILTGKIDIEYDVKKVLAHGERFKHNFQSVRVVESLEDRCEEYSGLNLTFAVREGILKHTKTKIDGEKVVYYNSDYEQYNLEAPSCTLEGQTVAIADEIAQCSHDLEDGFRSGIITWKDIKNDDLINHVQIYYSIETPKDTDMMTYILRNSIIKHLVGYLINDVCESSVKNIKKEIQNGKINNGELENLVINFSSKVHNLVENCTNTMNEYIINSEMISVSDAKAEYFIKQLFKAYVHHPKQLPDYILNRYQKQTGKKITRAKMNEDEVRADPIFWRIVCDHISGMTDQFASREYKRLYMPDYV